jgi:hypothetical protein
MTNTAAHENLNITVLESFLKAIWQQQAHNPLLDTPLWKAHTNRSSWYQDEDDDQYTADISIFFDDLSLFDVEVGFAQRWKILKLKIDRILADEVTWGVLAIKITETSSYSKPTHAPRSSDFVPSDTWKEQALLAQAVDEYGAISVNGIEWLKGVAVNVYLFPADWSIDDEDPQSVSYLILPSYDVSLHRRSIH